MKLIYIILQGLTVLFCMYVISKYVYDYNLSEPKYFRINLPNLIETCV